MFFHNKCGGGRALRIAVGIMTLGLFLAGSAGAATLMICPEGCIYSSIQAAVDASSNGDTIQVQSGTYYENVTVNKQLTLRGIGMPVVDAGGNGSVITLAADGITLEGFTAIGGGYSPAAGIKVISNNNTLIGNNASYNYYSGISLEYSSNNMLISNNASNNQDGYIHGYGISLEYSSNNTLSDNNASNNNGFCGICLVSSSDNTLSGNNANSNNYDGIVLDSSNNNTLSGNNASNNNYGIVLDSSNNNTLSGNNASNNISYSRGISLQGSSNNTLIGNNVNSNWFGIVLNRLDLVSSSDNTLIGNNASNNGIGISLWTSSNNTLIGNNANSNFGYSDLGEQYTGKGISLEGSSNNTLIDSYVLNNNIGIYLSSSSNNKIYNNVFNNSNNLHLFGSNVDTWNTARQSSTNIMGGFFLGGNFWAHPNGTGFSQTCEDSNRDGICDSFYILDSNNIDSLPLALVTTGVKGDLNWNGQSADAGDLVLMKRASIGEIQADSKYDLNNNGQNADAGDLVLMKRASIGEITLS